MKNFLLALILGLLWCNVGFAGEKDEYVSSADVYAKLTKKRGINAEAHVVKGGHDGKKTLLSYGKDIVKEALK